MNSKQLVAFYKGTAGDYLQLGPLAVRVISQEAFLRNHISPMQPQPCALCDGKGWIPQADGPDDYSKDECHACHGTGRVIANN
jgi:hypothetical protein